MRTLTRMLSRWGIIATSTRLALLLCQAGPRRVYAWRPVPTADGSTSHMTGIAGSPTPPTDTGRSGGEGADYNTAQGMILVFCASPSAVEVGDPTSYAALPRHPCPSGYAT